MNPERRRSSRLLPFLAVALLLHYVLMTALPALDLWRAPEAPAEPFEVAFVEPDETETEETREPERPPGQVVELPPPVEERHPDEARFVSEYDNRVDRETRAPVRRDSAAPPPAPETRRLAMRTVRPEPESPLERDQEGEEPGTPEPAVPDAPLGDAERPLTLKDLRPSEEGLSRALDNASIDYLKDVDEGDETLLNSKRWRFASFFNRVKRQVAENWHPEVAYRRRDPYGNIYGFRDRITMLRVDLRPDGSLLRLMLEQPCGVGFLDDEAIASFHAAQPFPNPPRQLVDPESGLISFRFAFIFELSGNTTFKVRRYSN